MTNLKINATTTGYEVTAENAILCQGSLEDCERYIRREAVTAIRYSYSSEEMESAAAILLAHLPEEKKAVFARTAARMDDSGFDFPVEIVETERGSIYLTTKNPPYSYSLYVTAYGEVTRKPRNDKAVEILADERSTDMDLTSLARAARKAA